jgi:hypothetical protein
LAKILAIKKKLINNTFLCKFYSKHPLQVLFQTSFASFVPNILSLQQTFFFDLAPLQLVYFAIVNGKMVATTIGWDCANI